MRSFLNSPLPGCRNRFPGRRFNNLHSFAPCRLRDAALGSHALLRTACESSAFLKRNLGSVSLPMACIGPVGPSDRWPLALAVASPPCAEQRGTRVGTPAVFAGAERPTTSGCRSVYPLSEQCVDLEPWQTIKSVVCVCCQPSCRGRRWPACLLAAGRRVQAQNSK